MPEIRLQKLLGVHGTGQTEESRIQVMAAQTNARQRNQKSKLANQIAHQARELSPYVQAVFNM
ncbi:hypothetical protein T06_1366 [Trichinella sp. T6]|nr:hypothetical protein T06_1366 [Trichinella sp. T6]